MRVWARIAVIVILIGCSATPLLYGKKSVAEGASQSISAPKFAVVLSNWSHKIRLSEPGLLLILGFGLVVSSGRLPRLLNSRVYARRRPPQGAEAKRDLRLVDKKPFSFKAVS